MILQHLNARIPKKAACFFVACFLVTLRLIPLDEQTKNFAFCVGSFGLSAGILGIFQSVRSKLRSRLTGPAAGMLFSAVSAGVSAVALTLIYQSSVLDDYYFASVFSLSGLVRIYLLFWPLNFINCYILFDTEQVSDFLFRNRWKVAAFLACALIAAKVHFYNASCFSYYIQPEYETPFTMPLFGTPRQIRSDEWMVNIPRNLVAEYSGYGKFNYLLRGTENYNIGSSGLYLSYSALSNVFNLGYYLFGSEYGLSFFTVTCFIFTFMISFEFSYIITNQKRLPALLGACLLGLSQFSLWWSMVLQLPALLAVVVCAYYFFETDKGLDKVLLAAGVALAGAMFICNLYPAWQVPFAYIILALLIWVFISHWNPVKAMQKQDWIIITGAFVFMCSIVASYLYDNRAYSTAVMATVYPGARFSTGGYSLDKLLSYPASLLYSFKDTGNNSEAGTFFSLFPLPILFSVWILLKEIYGCRKEKRTVSCDVFLLCQTILTLFFLAFCTVGIPKFLAKYTLMSYVPAIRCADALGLTSVFLLLRILGMEKVSCRSGNGKALGIIFLAVLWAIATADARYKGFMPAAYVACLTIGMVLFATAVFCPMDVLRRKWILLAMTAAIAIPGLTVLPITRGLDSILQKPASWAIQEIVQEAPDAKWIALGELTPPQFLVANGASTINSNNYIPNMELWTKLDPDGKYNEVYNRYSHVDVVLTDQDTYFKLIAPDFIRVYLSYSDMETAEITYIFSIYPVSEESGLVDFNLLYEQSGIYIYEVVYLT